MPLFRTDASRQRDKRTALHYAAGCGPTGRYYPGSKRGDVLCAESLIKAGADASLKDAVSEGRQGVGGRRGNMGGGRGRGGGGPCAGAAPPLRAALAPTLFPGAAVSPPPPTPPFPGTQGGKTALDTAKAMCVTQVVRLLDPAGYPAFLVENASAIAAKVGPRRPHPCTAPARERGGGE